jgi:uncharacterized membrane protein YbhN (UPF0104 family)
MKLKVGKLIVSLSFFFVAIKLSNISLNLDFYNFKIFLGILFFTSISLFAISLRTQIIYNYNRFYKFISILIFNLKSWCLTNIFFSFTADIMKIFYYKNLRKENIFSFIIIEKFINLISILCLFIFVTYLIYYKQEYKFIYINLFISFLIVFILIIFKFSFYLKFLPYLNFIDYALTETKKNFSFPRYISVFFINIFIQLISIIGFFFVFYILNIKISIQDFLILYLFHYLSGLIQLFPSGLGLREFLFYFSSNFINLKLDILISLALIFTITNILISILILVCIYFFKRKLTI